MKSYSLAPHIADIRLIAEADSVEDLFRTALDGMNAILRKQPITPTTEGGMLHDIRIEAPDTTALLVDFLSEVLTLAHTDNAIFHTVKFMEFEPCALKARLYGAPVSGFDEDIKAVTYHEADVASTDGAWKTTIIFDI